MVRVTRPGLRVHLLGGDHAAYGEAEGFSNKLSVFARGILDTVVIKKIIVGITISDRRVVTSSIPGSFGIWTSSHLGESPVGGADRARDGWGFAATGVNGAVDIIHIWFGATDRTTRSGAVVVEDAILTRGVSVEDTE